MFYPTTSDTKFGGREGKEWGGREGSGEALMFGQLKGNFLMAVPTNICIKKKRLKYSVKIIFTESFNFFLFARTYLNQTTPIQS